MIITSHTKQNQSPDFTVRRKHQINTPPPSDTPGNERLSNQPILKSAQPTGQHLSVTDIHPNPCEISVPLPNSQNLAGPFFRPKLAVSTINTRLNSDQIQKNTSPTGNKLAITTSASELGQSQTISQGKTYQKVYNKAYAQTEKRWLTKKLTIKPSRIPVIENKQESLASKLLL